MGGGSPEPAAAAGAAALLRACGLPRLGLHQSGVSAARDDAAGQSRPPARTRVRAARPPAHSELRRLCTLQLEAIRSVRPDRARQYRHAAELRPPLRRALV